MKDTLVAGEKFELKRFTVLLYSATLKYHLWYLYAYITYLISIPFLQSLVKYLRSIYFYYMIGITLFFEVLRLLEYLLGDGTLVINSWLKVAWLTSSIVIYPCVGFFLEHRVNINSVGKKLLLLWLVNVILLIWPCYATYCMGKKLGNCTSQTFHSSFALMSTITIYLSVKYLCNRIQLKKWFSSIICSIGSCTFGIYLLHPLIKESSFFSQLQDLIFKTGMNQMLASWIFVFVLVLCCWLITWGVRKIPVIKIIVGG